MAERHWRRWLPSRVAVMNDPSSFFSVLGEEVAARIEDLAADLAGNDPSGETYMQKVGRLNMARLRAEEIVVPELVLLPPEPGLEEPEDSNPEPPIGRQKPTPSGP
jgi:hypothetical protein